MLMKSHGPKRPRSGRKFPQTEKTTDSTQAATLLQTNTSKAIDATMLGFALGGMILNLMPLYSRDFKILGFVEQELKSQKVFQMGLLDGLGVLVSFWALASIVIAIQSTGQSANWGMQFQNPQFLLS